MPDYTFKSPDGRQVTLRGDTAPSADAVRDVFSQLTAQPTPRHALDIMGGDSKMDRDRQLLKSDSGRAELVARNERGNMGLLADIGMEGGGAAAGQLIGAIPALSVPTGGASIPIGGALGGAGGNIAAQRRRIAAGEQNNFSVGQLLSAALTSAIPGGGTGTGAKLLAREALKQGAGGFAGKTIETAVDDGRLPSAKETLLSTLLPAVGGALAQKLSSKGVDALNPTTRATLEAGKEAGLVVPPSVVSDSALNKRLESVAGKAAVGQEAALKNQETTNRLAKQALGLPDNADISMASLRALRDKAAEPYREIQEFAGNAANEASALKRDKFTASDPHELAIQMADPDTQAKLKPLLIQAAGDVDALKNARYDANKWRKHYLASADPESLDKARAASSLADALENRIEQAAETIGAGEQFVNRLRAARTLIAKSYDVEHALNLGTGDISAPVLARSLDKGRPLTGDLETVAKFAEAFPTVMREGAKIPTPGVSKVEAGLAALLAATGAGASHSPYGLLAGALPLASGPTRALLLSSPYQKIMTGEPFSMPKTGTVTRVLSQAAGQETPR